MGENEVKYIVRQIKVSDCHKVEQLWSMVDFLGSLYENQVMLKVDPQGTFVAQDVNTGQLLGICSGINISTDLAFIGQYGVRPDYQRLGIGSALWRAAIEHMGPHRNIGLRAMDSMFDKYVKRSNFKLFSENRAMRYSGKADCSQLIEAIDGISVVPISEDNIEKVIQYDRQICEGIDRTVLLKEISKIGEYVNAVAVNREQEILGYCVVKVSYLKTGIVEPLYANDQRIAELLLGKCCRSLPITQTNGLVYPSWNSNPLSLAIIRKMGLKEERSTVVLFTKNWVEGDVSRVFCVSSRIFFPF